MYKIYLGVLVYVNIFMNKLQCNYRGDSQSNQSFVATAIFFRICHFGFHRFRPSHFRSRHFGCCRLGIPQFLGLSLWDLPFLNLPFWEFRHFGSCHFGTHHSESCHFGSRRFWTHHFETCTIGIPPSWILPSSNPPF